MTLSLTHQIVKYGTIVFIVGLTSLFVFCTWARVPPTSCAR